MNSYSSFEVYTFLKPSILLLFSWLLSHPPFPLFKANPGCNISKFCHTFFSQPLHVVEQRSPTFLTWQPGWGGWGKGVVCVSGRGTHAATCACRSRKWSFVRERLPLVQVELHVCARLATACAAWFWIGWAPLVGRSPGVGNPCSGEKPLNFHHFLSKNKDYCRKNVIQQALL